MTEGMTPIQEAAALKIAKLLALGTSNNENEATAAMLKAQDLMAEFNLDMAKVGAVGGEDGKRQELMQRGGNYKYQRSLWATISELNFCLCITAEEWEKYKVPRLDRRGNMRSGQKRRRIGVIGKKVNVRAVIAMATYLEQVIDRLCTERLHGRGEGWKQFYSRWAVSWREGMAQRIAERLQDRRKKQLSTEEAAKRAAIKKGMDSASTATALTLVDVAQQEKDLNRDFLNGQEPGTTARHRAENAAATAKAEAAYAAWAAANPEEARKQNEEAEARREKYWKRYRGGGGEREREKDWGAYSEGYKKGGDVSLDQQMDEGKVAGRIGRG